MKKKGDDHWKPRVGDEFEKCYTIKCMCKKELISTNAFEMVKHHIFDVTFTFYMYLQCLIVCSFVLRFWGPVNPMGSCRARSVYLTTLLLGRLSPKRLISIVHILLPETDNCPSWISRREKMTVKYFMINLHERMLPMMRSQLSQGGRQCLIVNIPFISTALSK